MLVDFFAHGTGRGTAPVRYCIDLMVPKFDPKTRLKIKREWAIREPAPEVLRGDPDRTIMLIDSSQNKWKYTSGVIAFADTDNPTQVDIEALIDDFEKSAFAGLQREQYDILWTRHLHEGNVELHFVSPRLELLTGKALNIAPPGHEVMFDAWRDKWNFSRGWASPDEPERARMGKSDDITLKMEAAAMRSGMATHDDPRVPLTEYLLQCIESGKVRDRDDVLAELAYSGLIINRVGKDYISVRETSDAKPMRLKGRLYESGFKIDFDRAAALRAELGLQPSGPDAGQDAAGSSRNPERDAERVSAASRVLTRFIDSRNDFNRSRYRVIGAESGLEFGSDRHESRNDFAAERGISPEQWPASERFIGDVAKRLANHGRLDADDARRNIDAFGREVDGGATDSSQIEQRIHQGIGQDSEGGARSAQGTERRHQEADATASMDHESADVGTPNNLPSSVRRSLGLDRAQNESSSATRSDGGLERQASKGADQPIESRILRNGNGSGSQLVCVSNPLAWFEISKQNAENLYDRTRTAIIEKLVTALSTIRGGHEAVGWSKQALTRSSSYIFNANNVADNGLIRNSLKLEQCIRDVEHQINKLIVVAKLNSNDEIKNCNLPVHFSDATESRNNTNEREQNKSWDDLLAAWKLHLAKKQVTQVAPVGTPYTPKM